MPAVGKVAAIALCEGVVVKLGAPIVFARFTAGPARSGHEDPEVRRHLEDVAQVKSVLRHAIKCGRWTLYRHNSHRLLLREQGSKLAATFVIKAGFLKSFSLGAAKFYSKRNCTVTVMMIGIGRPLNNVGVYSHDCTAFSAA